MVIFAYFDQGCSSRMWQAWIPFLSWLECYIDIWSSARTGLSYMRNGESFRYHTQLDGLFEVPDSVHDVEHPAIVFDLRGVLGVYG